MDGWGSACGLLLGSATRGIARFRVGSRREVLAGFEKASWRIGSLPVIAERRSANSNRIAVSASWMVPASHRTKCRPKP